MADYEQVREDLANWIAYNFIETGVESGLFDDGETNLTYGMEKEFLIVDEDGTSIDEEGKKEVEERLLERDGVYKEDDEVVVGYLDSNEGVDPSVPWDMGTNECEITTAPFQDPRRAGEQANELYQVVEEAAAEAGYQTVNFGIVPGAVHPDIEGEPYDPDSEDPTTMEDIFVHSNAGGSNRYSLHGFEMSGEAEDFMDMEPALRILGSASHQLTMLPSQFADYFEGATDAAVDFVETVQERGMDPTEVEVPDELMTRVDRFISDLYGTEDRIGMNRLTALTFADDNASLKLNENGEAETYNQRIDAWDALSNGKMQTRRWLTHPGFPEIDSLEAFVDFYATEFIPEFGPEVELDGEEVPTAFAKEDGKRKTLKQVIEDESAHLVAVDGKELQRDREELNEYEFLDLEENIYDFFDLHVSGFHPEVRVRPSMGMLEFRTPGNSPDDVDNAVHMAAQLDRFRDVQDFMREEYGITGIPHEPVDYVSEDIPHPTETDQQGVMNVRRGVAQEQRDFVIPGNLHDVDGELTVGDLLTGTPQSKGVYDLEAEILRESIGFSEDESEGWRESRESKRSPAEKVEEWTRAFGGGPDALKKAFENLDEPVDGPHEARQRTEEISPPPEETKLKGSKPEAGR